MSPWHAQHGQDELVVEVLLQKRNGFFVDLAAGDAIQWSNTLSLERLFDWSGLCIEPQADRLEIQSLRCLRRGVGSITNTRLVVASWFTVCDHVMITQVVGSCPQKLHRRAGSRGVRDWRFVHPRAPWRFCRHGGPGVR